MTLLPKIDAPTFTVDLLSTGGTMLCRPYLAKEEKILLQAKESEDEKVIYDAIKQTLVNCCLDESVNINKLPMFDVENLFIELRKNSTGSVVEFQTKCPECGHEFKTSFDFDGVGFSKKPSDGNVHLVGNVGINFSYPTLNAMESASQKKSKAEKMFELIYRCVEYVYDGEQVTYSKDISKKELEEFIDSLTQDLFHKVCQFFEEMPMVRGTLECDCPQCGHKESKEVEGLANFFTLDSATTT